LVLKAHDSAAHRDVATVHHRAVHEQPPIRLEVRAGGQELDVLVRVGC
jgi:hypothetical protein